MASPQDKKLIIAAQADPAAFKRLYDKYANRIYNYFWYRVGHNKDVAEDLMQETFTKAFKTIPRYQEQGYSYHTYLRTIAHNILVSYYRRPQTLPLNEAISLPDEPIQNIADKVDARLVWDAVRDNLSPAERNIVLLRYRQNLPLKEIAHIIGKSPNAVKLQLSRARRKLRHDIRLSSLYNFQDVTRHYTPPDFLRK